MKGILEVNAAGSLIVPPAMLPNALPQTRYAASLEAGALVIKPEVVENEYWKSTTPAQRARDFLEWANGHATGPGLSDWAVSRDSIYD